MKILENKLFAGLEEAEAAPYLTDVRGYAAGEFVVKTGDKSGGFGVVLSGDVQVFKEDYFGNRSILSLLHAGDLFLEAVTLTRPDSSPVNVIALTDCRIALLDYDRLLAPCGSCKTHAKILENLLRVVSTKVLALNRRISVLSARSIRERVLAYLKEESGGRTEFALPFNREELASYLCVDRSALSRELSQMKKRGEIDFSGNLFRVRADRLAQS